jgi:thioredoxin reductase
MYDVIVIGAGPGGLAAGFAAKAEGAGTLIIERESRPGGILKQCIHDGFGLIRFKERLSGPEYAERYIKMVREKGIEILTSTFVHSIEREGNLFNIKLLNADRGVFNETAKALVVACGCRERTPKQVFIHGARPSGVYTAGTAQYFVNVQGFLPCKKCVILGSGDIGLIMARRLTLEGAKVVGVFEAKSTPSGLSRNIAQCLEDFSIPLHLSATVTRIIGSDRVEAVEVSRVDDAMQPIPGTEEIIECDGLILSVGLIPENEIVESLKVEIDNATKGPFVDQSLMTTVPGVFSCGNSLHVNDLVDYVSESGETAGKSAARYSRSAEEKQLVKVEYSSEDFLYVVPQYIDVKKLEKTVIYFRSKYDRKKARVQILTDGSNKVFDRKYASLKPPEMEKAEIKLSEDIKKIQILMQEDSK